MCILYILDPINDFSCISNDIPVPPLERIERKETHNVNFKPVTKTHVLKTFGKYISKFLYFYENCVLDFIYHWFIPCEVISVFTKNEKYDI